MCLSIMSTGDVKNEHEVGPSFYEDERFGMTGSTVATEKRYGISWGWQLKHQKRVVKF